MQISMDDGQTLSIDIEALQTLARIGNEMVASDNRMTMAPVWFEKGEAFPRFFLSELAAERYFEDNHIPKEKLTVACASHNPQILDLMQICLEVAGQTEHAQAKNCYSVCFR